MKRKIWIMFAVFAVIGSLSACKANVSKNNEEEFMTKAAENIECIASCVEEIFCADIISDTRYIGFYENEKSYDNGNGDVKILTLEENAEEYKEYFTDPTDSSYYEVKNFKTNDEVREHLAQHMSEDVIDNYFNDDFLEFDDKLYMRRGSRGYGAVTCDKDSFRLVEEKDGKMYAKVDFMIFDEYDHTKLLEFTNIDGNWIITDETEVSEK